MKKLTTLIFLPAPQQIIDLQLWGTKNNIVSKQYHHVENSSLKSATLPKTIV